MNPCNHPTLRRSSSGPRWLPVVERPSMARALLLAVVLACSGVSTALAQDPAQVDPHHYQVLLENDRVRVLRVEFGPHEESVMHSRPDAVAIYLTDGEAKFTDPEGKSEERRWKAGEVAWERAARHLTENPSGEAWVLILAELKGEAPPTYPLPMRVGKGREYADLAHYVPPLYPPLAKAEGVQGVVVLRALIGKEGSIETLRYASGPPLLVMAAMDAVRQWRFEPPTINGEPVKVETVIPVVFALP